MCIIGNLLYKGVFGRHPVGDGQPVTASAERLMGPGFSDLNDSTNASRKLMAALPREELTVVSADGLTLVGCLLRNPVPTDKTAVCIHGYNSTGFVDFATVGLEYLRRGFNLLLPTNRACGGSQGEWTTFGVRESEDTLLWLQKTAQLFPGGDIVLHGCSLGGAAVCMTADLALPPNVRAIVADCPFASMRDEFRHMIKFVAHLPAQPLLGVLERQFRRHTGCGFDDRTPLKSVANAKTPMFFVHGREDRYIPCESSQRLYDVCPTDRQLLFIDGAGHAAAHMRGKERYYGPIFAFLARHMTLPAAAVEKDPD